MIKVSNGYIARWDSGHYIGRAGKGKKGSALANPFKLKNTSDSEERDCVIAFFAASGCGKKCNRKTKQ